MKRLFAVVIAVASAAAAFAAWGVAAPSEPSLQGPAGVAPDARRRLPALPAEVRQRRRWRIGVKCDTPPFGYTDANGRNAGLDVEIARWFARFAFGNARRVTFECVTTASRIPALEARRVDLIIATITWFPSRAQQIDFSTPYYAETGRLLVRRGTSLTLRQLAGKTITTTGGSIYDSWLQTCFRQTTRLTFQGTANPLLALKDGRADAFMYDAGFLLEYVQRDPDVRLTREVFARAPWGIGIRKGERAMRNWVNSRLNLLRQRDQFRKMLRQHTTPSLFRILRGNVPTPSKTLRYPRATTQEEMLPCPS
jgi:polar amino acid transport system substrate-binding protein